MTSSNRTNHRDFRVYDCFYCVLLYAIVSIVLNAQGFAADGKLAAGVFAKNITPTHLPVWVNGGIAGRQIDRINDPLHARCLVLGDGQTQIAICIVDNCILPLNLVDTAKALAQTKTGIAAERILIAATHTHSAVAVDGVHGTPIQQDYADSLPGWIAEGIAEAQKRMVPAQWGTTSVVCEQYIYCRDWMMKPGKANSSPFSGRISDSVSMNPGHDNPNKLAPVGPVDTLVPVLSIQDLEGNPISVFASFCTHYAGAPNLSADYFGVVCERLAKSLRPDTPDAFMGIMANATSGNANCIDFSKPAVPFTHVEVGTYVSDKILAALPSIVYSSQVAIDAELQSIELAVRMPNETEVATAKKYIETHMPDRLPKTMDENYARETVLLSEMPSKRKLNLQAIRLNDFVILANPCESYNETGLKLRQASPFRLTMNIGLANGHAGYIPPPELFQLGGYTTWRCRSSCLEEQAEPKMVDGLVRVLRTLDARKKTGKGLASQTKPNSPVPPRESLQWIETEPGYRVELAAAEPQIVDPVSMRIDRLGRMWVVEMGDYPNKDNAPKSRIVVLQDKNHDGFYETSTVFAEKLLFATGVQPWQNGALVTVEGQLLMLRDTDGDLRADKTEVWLEGFSTGNPQLRANHPIIHSDGWLYIASGLRGGKIASKLPFGNSAKETLDLTGSDLRIHMLTGKMESIAGPSQFGLTFDQFGRRYGCSNRNPCFEIVSERSEIGLSPLSGLATAIRDVSPSNAASSVFPLVDAWTTSNLHAGQFTAACGVLVTHSRHFQSPSFATVLTCEPTGSLIQRRSVERRDGILQVVAEPSQREWVASRDPWFRPVDTYEGPNGEIYIVDMYRAVIEHPEWVPSELKNRPDQRLGESHGRIYRITNKNTSLPQASDSATMVEDISKWLTHPGTWNRNMASQSVLEAASMGDKAEHISKLKSVCKNNTLASGAIANAVLLLTALESLDGLTIEPLLHHPDPELRSMAWRSLRQSDTKESDALTAAAIKTIGDPTTSVDEKQSASWFLAAKQTDTAQPREKSEAAQLHEVAAKTLLQSSQHPHLWMAIAAACRDSLIPMIERFREAASVSDQSALDSITRENLIRLASRAVQLAKPDFDLQKYTDAIAKGSNPRQTPLMQSCDFAILEGIARSGKLAISPDSVLESLALRTAASDADAILQQASIGLLASSSSEAAKATVLRTLKTTNISLLKKAIATCSAHDTDEFAAWLVERIPSALPEIRQDIFNAIRSNPKRLALLVDQLESGELSAKVFDASQIQSLATVRDSSIAPRLNKILSASINTNRQRVIEDYSKQLASSHVDPNANQGKTIFAKNCSACHRLDGIGTPVGPDISDSREQSFEKLLVSILDPNRSIDANYFRYRARTDDGVVLEGLLKDSNSQTISLLSQNGTMTTLQRSNIEELLSSGTSLMPEGVESQIAPQEMAELLWYIKNWRYAAENIPANATIK